ncbi:MAG: hypothetical protein ABEJ92_06095 [Halobacteriales archaeon]
MVTTLSGAVGGLVATIVMTVFMMLLGDDSPPPTASFWSKYVGDGQPPDYVMQGMVLHLIYGIVAGAVFALAVPIVGVSVATVGSAVLWGLVWGVVLFVFGAAFWMMMVLGMEPEMKMVGMFLVFHLIYGAVLGAWVGYGFLA